MEEKITIFESDYLSYELMSNTNNDFVLSEFKHIEALIKDESGWESIPEWLVYISNKPIGNKPFPTSRIKIIGNEFYALLQSNGWSEINNIEIIADENGRYTLEIRNSKIFTNSQHHLIISETNDVLENICLIPSEESEISNSLDFIVDKYNLLLVDWNEKKIF